MGLTTDRADPGIRNIRADGQQEVYLILSDEERAKGFVRPVRRTYLHVGCRPKGPTRPLTPDEQQRYGQFGYVCYEPYGPEREPVAGRYWTAAQLSSGCGATTTMGQAIAETYARNPAFYSGTFCSNCGKHFPVGADGEFVWDGTDERVGT